MMPEQEWNWGEADAVPEEESTRVNMSWRRRRPSSTKPPLESRMTWSA